MLRVFRYCKSAFARARDRVSLMFTRRKFQVAYLLFILAVPFWIMIRVNLDHMETQQQAQGHRAADVAAVARQRALCHIKSVCSQYGAVRQECATAGNFHNCIGVKLGDRDITLIDQCTNAGTLRDIPVDLPNAVECFFTKSN
jgi:hypothetical protein